MKKTIYTLFALLAVTVAGAQTSTHELSVSGFGGLQGLSVSANNGGTASLGIGFGGGLGYAYNLNSQWSIVTGADFAYYSSDLKYGTLENTYEFGLNNNNTTDGATFKYTVDNYEETQNALLVEIPVMARYTLPIGQGGQSLRFAAGAKIGLPLSAGYTASAARHKTTEVELEYENQTYAFDEAKAVAEYDGDIDASMSMQIAIEAAYRIPVGEKMGMSIGVYFNYGLNSMQGRSDDHLVTFDTTQEIVNTQPPQHTYNASALNTGLVSAFRPMAVGLKLRFDLGL